MVPTVRYAKVMGEKRWRLCEVLRLMLDVGVVAMAYCEAVHKACCNDGGKTVAQVVLSCCNLNIDFRWAIVDSVGMT